MIQRVKAKKELGQHFLCNQEIAHRIAHSLVPSGSQEVLEVGPGMGVLTKYLISDHLRVVEIDRESIQYLGERYPSLNIIHGDFLQLPLDELFPEGVNIIGNFPYNISSQIFFKVLDHKEHVPQIVGMLQKEVARRICATPTGKEYGILSVLLQAYYTTEYLFEVGPENFEPQPKVQSAVIRLKRNEVMSLDCNEILLK
ncbi:MAG: 16S rRNA (adenine(1518)-N(6)/adenine(1519)-N(6))-dimethyltransferase RsmA, partial [Mucinivorans sp.]